MRGKRKELRFSAWDQLSTQLYSRKSPAAENACLAAPQRPGVHSVRRRAYVTAYLGGNTVVYLMASIAKLDVTSLGHM